MGRFNARRTRAEWEVRRTEALHHLTLAAEIMRYQARHARMGSLEQPPQVYLLAFGGDGTTDVRPGRCWLGTDPFPILRMGPHRPRER